MDSEITALTMEGACRALLLAHDGGWDEPPVIWFAFQEPGHVRLQETTLIDAAAREAREPFPTPGHMLAAMASTAAGWGVARVSPPNLIGLVMYTEAWRIARDRRDVAAEDQHMAYARDRKIHTHPAREGVRSVYAAQTGQRLFTLEQVRDSREVQKIEVTGGVPNGLRALAAAVVPGYWEPENYTGPPNV